MSNPYMAQQRSLENRRPPRPLSLSSLIGFPNEEVARQQRIPLDEVKRVFQAFIDFGLIVYRPPAAALTWTMTSAIALATSSSVGGRS